MTQDELNAALAASPSPDRVTPEYLKSRIYSVGYIDGVAVPTEHPDAPTLTICVITLDNGFTVTGESACVDPANYRQDIGREIAYRMAEGKIWPLLGFALKEAVAARAALADSPEIEDGFAPYVSHKRVEAAPIAAAEFEADRSGRVALKSGEIVQVPADFYRKGQAPEEGDMLVRYADGYLSWSPRGAFLDGYRNAE